MRHRGLVVNRDAGPRALERATPLDRPSGSVGSRDGATSPISASDSMVRCLHSAGLVFVGFTRPTGPALLLLGAIVVWPHAARAEGYQPSRLVRLVGRGLYHASRALEAAHQPMAVLDIARQLRRLDPKLDRAYREGAATTQIGTTIVRAGLDLALLKFTGGLSSAALKSVATYGGVSLVGSAGARAYRGSLAVLEAALDLSADASTSARIATLLRSDAGALKRLEACLLEQPPAPRRAHRLEQLYRLVER